MGDRYPWKRWQHADPQPGDRCHLDEAREGWLVRLDSGDEVTVLGGLHKNRRVHRHGDPSLLSLSNDTMVEVVSVRPLTRISEGSWVKVLAPSKERGRVGLVSKVDSFYTVTEPNRGTFRLDRDFLIPINVRYVEIEDIT